MNWYKISKLEEKWWNNIYYHILNASDLILKEYGLEIDKSSFVVFLEQDILNVSFWVYKRNKQYKCLIKLKLNGTSLENHDYLVLNGSKQKEIDLTNTNLIRADISVLGKENNSYYIVGKGSVSIPVNPGSLLLKIKDIILKDKGPNNGDNGSEENSPFDPSNPKDGLKKEIPASRELSSV